MRRSISCAPLLVLVLAACAPGLAPEDGPLDAGNGAPLHAQDAGSIDSGITVTTLAGNDRLDVDGPRQTAELAAPSGVAVDGQGNIFFSDNGNAVRRIDATGNVTTIAGGGPRGYADGPGSTAALNGPLGVAVDAQGNVYVADEGNRRIRRIDPAGNVTTLAGNGTPGEADGAGDVAEFTAPAGVAVDTQGDVYVVDEGDDSIRRIDPEGYVTTFAGIGSGCANGTDGPANTALFCGPQGVAVDAHGNVYVADTLNHRIRKINPDGNVTTLAGNGTLGSSDGTGGPAGTAEFSYPQGIAVDVQDNVYVADQDTNTIRRIDPAGNVTTVAGSGPGYADGTGGPSGTALFLRPTGVAVTPEGNLSVADQGNNRVRGVDTQGNVTTLAGNGLESDEDGTGGPNGTAEVQAPLGVAVDVQGIVYVADQANNSVRRIDLEGNVTTLAGNGTPGFVDGTGGRAGTARLSSPGGVAVSAQGDIYVADSGNSRIRRIDPEGNVTTLAGNGVAAYADGTGGASGTAEFYEPLGVAVDAQGNVYVADSGNNRVRRIDPAGNVTTLAGNGTEGSADGTGGPDGTAEFDGVAGIAVDGQGYVYVADEGNGIRKLDPAGNVITLPGLSGDVSGGSTGTVNGPRGVTVDAAGRVYVGDYPSRVVELDPAGQFVRTLAGLGPGDVDGPGGPDGTAEFNGVAGVAVDGRGNVLVADTQNNRIRRIVQ